jgi:hypothetical protein
MKSQIIRILVLVAFSFSAMAVAQKHPSKSPDDSHALLVKYMKFIELSMFAFKSSFTQGCITHQSREFCSKHIPKLNSEKLQDLYVLGLKREMTNKDLEPIIQFLETRNGQIFSEISYQQNIGNKRYLDGIPDISAEKIEAINQFRQTPGFKNFEVKLNQFYAENMNAIQLYILKESAIALKAMVLE